VSNPNFYEVSFSSVGSHDPEGQPLSYSWTFGDGASSTAANPTHAYTGEGEYQVRLAVSDGANTTHSQILSVSIGNPPQASIVQPLDGATFRAGDVISFSGIASDIDDGVLPASAYSWTILFHHDSHSHPAIVSLNGVASGQFTIPSIGHDFEGDTSYEIILVVTDSDGLKGGTSVIINPDKVSLSFHAVPSGLALGIDGLNRATPFVKETLVGFQHMIGAADQAQGGIQYSSLSWSDGGAQSHTIIVPGAALTYVATFEQEVAPLPSGLVLAYGFDEGTGTTATDSSGGNHGGSLVNGAAWSSSGKYGKALSLDGSNDFVQVNSPALPTGDFTCTSWVYLDTLPAFQAIASVNGAVPGLELDVEGSRIVVYSNGARCITSSGTVAAGAWSHVALVRSGNTLRLYLNGVLDPASGTTTGAQNVGTCALLIGADADSGCLGALNGYLDGRIDEFRVYNRTLNGAEIQADLNTPTSPPPPPLPDTTPPVRSNGQPSGVLPAGTTQATISLLTDENALCRFSTVPGTPFASMSGLFETTGGTAHSATVTGLTDGTTYNCYIRSMDTSGNVNADDFVVTFSIAMPPPPDTVPPTVTLTAPAPGLAVSGTVSVAADASDSIGVVGVQFLLDGTTLGSEDATSPYGISWNTAGVGPGQHTLAARARDAAGNQATSAGVTVTVVNAVTGLVAAYSFNEGAGVTVFDASGNLNSGTISGAVWTTAGKYGKALQFNGLVDWVTVADANSLDLSNGMTLEAWVFPMNSPAGWRTILAKEQNDELIYALYASSKGNNQPLTEVFVNGTPRNLTGGTRLPGNTWTHLAATFNGSVQRLYVNGTQVASRNQSGSMAPSSGAVRIGGNSVFGEYFKGIIDEVRIYNRVLTQGQIQVDMNTTILP
jgi:PKD repeat protein